MNDAELMPQNSMTQLYDKLGNIGFPRKYLREIVLPDWWDDKIAHNPAGYNEGLLILSRNLGLDLSSMQNDAVPIGLRNLGPCKFKKTGSTKTEELMLARALSSRVADLVRLAVAESKRPFLTSASQIRETILAQGAQWISLHRLLDYCWSVGLPVVPVTVFPPKVKKMEGLASVKNDRYAIVLSKSVRYSAWLLFILAHELGHIVKGHVKSDGALVDEVVDRKSLDKEEQAANIFAVNLLTGNPETQVEAKGAKASARALVQAALQAGKNEHIDPGHLVLNCAYQMGGDFFAVANAALRLLEPHADAVGLVRSKMIQHLDKTALSEETFQFILRVSGSEPNGDLSF